MREKLGRELLSARTAVPLALPAGASPRSATPLRIGFAAQEIFQPRFRHRIEVTAEIVEEAAQMIVEYLRSPGAYQ